MTLPYRVLPALHQLGGQATTPQLIAELGLNPTQLSSLYRVLRNHAAAGMLTEAPGAGRRPAIWTLTQPPARPAAQ